MIALEIADTTIAMSTLYGVVALHRRNIPRKGDAGIVICGQDQAHMATSGRHSPSVARALSDLEREALAAIALALPASWVVTVEPPHGQVSISPVMERNRFHRCWVASGSQRRIYRDDALGSVRPKLRVS
jgi:hypothetical protein